MQLKRIVVGIDFSRSSIAAARWSAAYLAPGGELVLAHTVDVPQPPRFLRGRFPQAATLTELALRGAEETLGELAVTLDHPSIQTRVEIGRPAEQLAALAHDIGADVIVVGKQGKHGGPWNHVGGVADELLRLSAVPVLVAAGPQKSLPRRILVALDDAELTPIVVGWTRTLAESFGAEVTAFHVMSSAVLSHVLSMEAVTTGKTAFSAADIEAEFRDESDRWIARLLGHGLDPARVTSEVAFGEAGQEILAAADRLSCDLIVVGRRGAGDIRRFFLGSVTRAVLAGARCPVFVVTEPRDQLEPENTTANNGPLPDRAP